VVWSKAPRSRARCSLHRWHTTATSVDRAVVVSKAPRTHAVSGATIPVTSDARGPARDPAAPTLVAVSGTNARARGVTGGARRHRRAPAHPVIITTDERQPAAPRPRDRMPSGPSRRSGCSPPETIGGRTARSGRPWGSPDPSRGPSGVPDRRNAQPVRSQQGPPVPIRRPHAGGRARLAGSGGYWAGTAAGRRPRQVSHTRLATIPGMLW